MTSLNEKAMNAPWDVDVRLRLARLGDELDMPEVARDWRLAAAQCPSAAINAANAGFIASTRAATSGMAAVSRRVSSMSARISGVSTR